MSIEAFGGGGGGERRFMATSVYYRYTHNSVITPLNIISDFFL